jgi:hypothetical protein
MWVPWTISIDAQQWLLTQRNGENREIQASCRWRVMSKLAPAHGHCTSKLHAAIHKSAHKKIAEGHRNGILRQLTSLSKQISKRLP